MDQVTREIQLNARGETEPRLIYKTWMRRPGRPITAQTLGAFLQRLLFVQEKNIFHAELNLSAEYFSFYQPFCKQDQHSVGKLR